MTLLTGHNLLAAPLCNFLYEGALTDAGGPAQGEYDIRFRLYDAAEAGNQSGPEVTLAPVAVADGRFTVTLDFGPGAFDGNPRWLELAVRSNGVQAAHAVLAPRQRILPLPYAIHADSASSVKSNGVTAAAIQNMTLTAEKFASNQVVKSLNGLRDNVELHAGANITLETNNDYSLTIRASIEFGSSNAVCCLEDWHVTGNLGTTAGANFLGTIDDEPLEVKVNSLRGLRLQPDAPTFLCDTISGTTGVGKSPSLIGGYFGNFITDGVAGSVIAGGGAFNHTCLGGEAPNIITADFAVISGGLGNRNDGASSSIGGGGLNYIGSGANGSLIAGGSRNYLSGDNDGATIGGGGSNVLGRTTRGSTIAGGVYNLIDQFSQRSTISGGEANSVGSNVNHVFIGGGQNNAILRASLKAIIGGGGNNSILSYSPWASILGGSFNTIGSESEAAAIGGGYANVIDNDCVRAVIAGGSFNQINASDYATVGGGEQNRLAAHDATIDGGRNNRIDRDSLYAVIGGGDANLVTTNAFASTISGGRNNLIGTDSLAAVIGGGNGNIIETANNHSTVAGGEGNRIGARAIHTVISGGSANEVAADARFGVIGGGDNNEVHDDFGTIDGGGSNQIKPGAAYSAIGGGGANVVDTNSHYSVISGGLQNRIAESAQQSAIGGGANNAIGSLSYWSAIGGGSRNTVYNSSDHAVIAGGELNAAAAIATTVSGGYQNSVGVNSPWSTIGGGQNNVVTNSQDAVISGGARNRINPGSASATIAGGEENTASAIAATVPGGRQAHARVWGQQAYAGGRFVQNGDAQTSTFVVRGTTSDATPRELFLDGAVQRIRVPAGGAWTFEVLVVARSSGGASAGYKLCGVIENNTGAGACVLVGAPELAFEREDVPAWNATVEADDASDALVVRVFGASGQSIRWVATVRTAEVIF
jgi:hypothetical protein